MPQPTDPKATDLKRLADILVKGVKEQRKLLRQKEDELIRDDVYSFVRKHQAQARKDARKTITKNHQQELKITAK